LNISTDYSHRKFFKNHTNALLVGDSLPNIDVKEKDTFRKLHSYIKDYLIINFISTSCKSCISALDALELIVLANEGLNIITLIDGDEQSIKQLQALFNDKVIFIPYSKSEMGKTLGVNLYPWSYGINAKGQVITSYNCENLETYHETLKPFLPMILQREIHD
jgi:hypothetical protein